MQRHTHQVAGLGVFLLINQQHPDLPQWIQALSLLAAYMGATAPDDLECPIYRHGQRSSLIPHRTLTHWMLPWVVITVFVTQQESAAFVASTSYCMAALVHILMDAFTRRGVPMLLPWR